MVVCEECAKLGSTYLEPEAKISKASYMSIKKPNASSTTFLITRMKVTNLHEELELTENFGSLIREAREKMGLSHEDLGRKIGEKVSVLKKVEGEKMSPDKKLAAKLEHILKVKLLVQAEEHEVPETVLPSSQLTFGEVARLKTGKRRNPENEGEGGISS